MQIQVHIINNNDKSSIHTPWFLYYIGSQFNNSFNLFRKDWDAVLLERLLGGRFHSPLYSIWRRSQKSPPVRSALHCDSAVQRPRTCFFCRCSASMESTTDIVETVPINRTVQAQTQNVYVYFIIRTIWKQQFLNCLMRPRSTCRSTIQTTWLY